MYEKFNLSPNQVDVISFANTFQETEFAQRMIFRGNCGQRNHNFSIDINPSYRYIEQLKGGFQCYFMNTNGFISNINFKLNNEKKELASINGQSVPFRLSIKQAHFFLSGEDIDQIKT